MEISCATLLSLLRAVTVDFECMQAARRKCPKHLEQHHLIRYFAGVAWPSNARLTGRPSATTLASHAVFRGFHRELQQRPCSLQVKSNSTRDWPQTSLWAQKNLLETHLAQGAVACIFEELLDDGLRGCGGHRALTVVRLIGALMCETASCSLYSCSFLSMTGKRLSK